MHKQYGKAVSRDKVNLFFGLRTCVEIVASFGNRKVNEYIPEEDFILGIMLGYERVA